MGVAKVLSTTVRASAFFAARASPVAKLVARSAPSRAFSYPRRPGKRGEVSASCLWQQEHRQGRPSRYVLRGTAKIPASESGSSTGANNDQIDFTIFS